jgi:capsular polysaccharide biosynthesis protein
LTLRDFFQAARRYRVTFLLVTAVVCTIGAAAIVLLPVRYLSSTRLLVSIEGSATAPAYQNEEVATRRIRSYIPLLTSGVVAQRVVDKLHLPMTSAELAEKISATNVPVKTSLIDIEVMDESADRAELIADTLAAEFIRYADAIETPTGEDSQRVHTTVVNPASTGRANRLERVILGALAGLAALVLGAVAVWIRWARQPGQLSTEQETSAPTIPSAKAWYSARHRAARTTADD